jgi:hypothetical protein
MNRVCSVSQVAPVLVLLLLALVAGCGGQESSSATTGIAETTTTESAAMGAATTTTEAADVESTTTSAAGSPTTTAGGGTTATSLSSSETDLGSGRVRAGGFVKRAYERSGRRLIDIDYADFLTGDEAEKAAAAAGEEFENDYFVRNVNPKVRTFSVSASTFELPQGQPDKPQTGDWEAFKAHVEKFPGTFWWIERQGDDIVLVEGQWVP